MIGIVGAGIGGLTLAHALRERGVEDVVVLELESRAGGVIRSSRMEGRVLDHGPQRTRLAPEVASLVRRLGLEERLRYAPEGLPLFVYRDRRLRRVPFSLPGLLRSDLLSLRGRARVLAEPLTGKLRVDETVGAFFRRKLGDEAYHALVGPLFGGLYGSDPDDMYARHALREVLAGLGIRRSLLLRVVRGAVQRAGKTPAVTFEDGMEELPKTLARELGSVLRLSTPVRRIRPDGSGWALDTEEGPFEVETVVVTTPAPVTATLVEGWDAGLAERLRALRYNELALVHLLGAWNQGGWGYQVAFGERLRTRGVTWNASVFGRDGVQTAFLGGAKDRAIADLNDDAVAEIARREFREVTGCDTRAVRVGRARVPAWDRSWVALDGVRELPHGLHLLANWESRLGIPARVRKAIHLAETLVRSGPAGAPSAPSD